MPITGAGVTLLGPDGTSGYIAASSRSALEYEKLQSEVLDGPCVAALADEPLAASAPARPSLLPSCNNCCAASTWPTPKSRAAL